MMGFRVCWIKNPAFKKYIYGKTSLCILSLFFFSIALHTTDACIITLNMVKCKAENLVASISFFISFLRLLMWHSVCPSFVDPVTLLTLSLDPLVSLSFLLSGTIEVFMLKFGWELNRRTVFWNISDVVLLSRPQDSVMTFLVTYTKCFNSNFPPCLSYSPASTISAMLIAAKYIL